MQKSSLRFEIKRDNSPGKTFYILGFGHQRLHARNLNFVRWLVGFTDGDGCFSIVKSNEKFNLSFSISQSVYNIRVLAFIKKHIGVGSISILKDKAVYRVRNPKHLAQFVFPLFEIYPLQTFKRFHAKKVQLATSVMLDQNLSTEKKRDSLSLLKVLEAPDNVRWWSLKKKNGSSFSKIDIDDDWLIGFIEAEGSFFITKKDNTQLVCAFAITQKGDSAILESIRERFSIQAKVQWKLASNAYSLESANQEALERINEFARGKFKGMKSLEYKLWSKALYYQLQLSKVKTRSESTDVQKK